MLGIVAHASNASQSLRIQCQLGLHSELQDSQSYVVRLCLEKEEERGGRGEKERRNI